LSAAELKTKPRLSHRQSSSTQHPVHLAPSCVMFLGQHRRLHAFPSCPSCPPPDSAIQPFHDSAPGEAGHRPRPLMAVAQAPWPSGVIATCPISLSTLPCLPCQTHTGVHRFAPCVRSGIPAAVPHSTGAPGLCKMTPPLAHPSILSWCHQAATAFFGSHAIVQLREDSRQSTPACTNSKCHALHLKTLSTGSILGSHQSERPAKGGGTPPVGILMFPSLLLPALVPLEDVFQSRVTISRSRCSSRSGRLLASLIACFNRPPILPQSPSSKAEQASSAVPAA